MFALQTKRLFLRHLHILDGEPLRRIFGDPEVMRFGDGAQSKEWVRAWLSNCLEHCYPTWGFGPYAVVERRENQVIGYCGLFFFPDVAGRPEIEIGYRLMKCSWGRGYATEAAAAVRDFAFDALTVKRLIAMIDPENTASIKVAKKIGMRYEKEVMFDGYTHPDHVYAIAAA
jgi:RimJ/RimL family protein N-acetyltransferase